MNTAITRPHRSEKLMVGEKSLLKAWIAKQRTFEEAAATVGVTKVTLYKVSGTGTGKPDTLKKIRAVINAATN